MADNWDISTYQGNITVLPDKKIKPFLTNSAIKLKKAIQHQRKSEKQLIKLLGSYSTFCTALALLRQYETVHEVQGFYSLKQIKRIVKKKRKKP